MYKVIIDRAAEQDLAEILEYISAVLHAPDAAKRLYRKIKQEIMSLDTMPSRCALIAEEPYNQLGIRKLFIDNYIAFLLINEDTKEVHVFRILYSRREWYNLI